MREKRRCKRDGLPIKSSTRLIKTSPSLRSSIMLDMLKPLCAKMKLAQLVNIFLYSTQKLSLLRTRKIENVLGYLDLARLFSQEFPWLLIFHLWDVRWVIERRESPFVARGRRETS